MSEPVLTHEDYAAITILYLKHWPLEKIALAYETTAAEIRAALRIMDAFSVLMEEDAEFWRPRGYYDSRTYGKRKHRPMSRRQRKQDQDARSEKAEVMGEMRRSGLLTAAPRLSRGRITRG